MSLKYSHCHAGGSGSPAVKVGSRSRVTAIRLACSGSSQPVAVVVRPIQDCHAVVPETCHG